MSRLLPNGHENRLDTDPEQGEDKAKVIASTIVDEVRESEPIFLLVFQSIAAVMGLC